MGSELPASSVQKPCGPAPRRRCLLGDDVFDLRAVAAEGKDSVKSTWESILRYELEIRKEALRRNNMCGSTRADGISPGRHSDDLPTRYLVTPLALGGRRQEPEAGSRNLQTKRQAQEQRLESSAKRQGQPPQTHNGKTICYMFQSPEGCSRGQECHHQHICAHCFGSHSFDACTKYTR